ncbi:uncharacterized protein PRCAT00000593001 [Priceomyces carsonii]|uniref:uncharacterized protein n=1 Tax=Priceomyces carsonii TaxID=28549 RepID=UPI002EDAFF41|nr:unnamed protein product [Priceomyces carsonii]
MDVKKSLGSPASFEIVKNGNEGSLLDKLRLISIKIHNPPFNNNQKLLTEVANLVDECIRMTIENTYSNKDSLLSHRTLNSMLYGSLDGCSSSTKKPNIKSQNLTSYSYQTPPPTVQYRNPDVLATSNGKASSEDDRFTIFMSSSLSINNLK